LTANWQEAAMQAQASTRPTDPQDPHAGLSMQDKELVARADERLARAYEQIAMADVQLARVNEQISTLDKDGARKKPRRRSRGRPALRGLLALLLTVGICAVALAMNSRGQSAPPAIAQWMPQLALASDASKLPGDRVQPAVQIAAADPAQTSPQDLSASPPPPDTTEQLQTMSRDLVSLHQEIQQLKANQEALFRESAATAEQIKESREQAARAVAMVSEQNARRPAATPLPVAGPARRPAVTAPTEARAQVRPRQLQAPPPAVAR
jgi:hypothetical protein